jgi:hypothetical protein
MTQGGSTVRESLIEAVGEDAVSAVRLWLSDVLDNCSLCVDEGTPNERVIPPSLPWLLEAIGG